MFRRCVLGAMALWIVVPAAGAAPSDYCKAYAIDFADQTKRDTAYWDKRFADAEKACLMQYSYEGSKNDQAPLQVAKAKSIAKPVVKKQPEPLKAAEEVEVAAVAVAPQPARKKPKLEQGSEAWLDYCDKKYASFNRKTGTYMSRTGVERKCLVTAN